MSARRRPTLAPAARLVARARLVATATLGGTATLIVAATPATATPPSSRPVVDVHVSPATTLDPTTREIAACGVRLSVIAGPAHTAATARSTSPPSPPLAGTGGPPLLVATLRQRREGVATFTEWCAQGAPPPTIPAPDGDRAPGAGAGEVTLTVPGMAALTVTMEMPAGAERCTRLQESSGLLFQRLFVAGGTLTVPRGLLLRGAVEDGVTSDRAQTAESAPSTAAPRGGEHPTEADSVTLTLKRPLPVAVSRAYLNCAGDLFRPEDEA